MALKNPAKIFIQQDVNEILVKLTGFDLNKIFKKTFNPNLRDSRIELMTESQLQKENKLAHQRARYLLQMPPFLNPREKSETILAKDDLLNPLNFKNSKYMFIDISLNVPHNDRTIVVREPNGILRKASYEERDKMIQVYYPTQGRTNVAPKMFEPAQLEEVLKLKRYMLILNKACVKYEPDDPEYIRVTHRVYDYVNEKKDYDELYSTRFYGPLMFYLVWYKKLNNIVEHLLDNSKIGDCVDLIRLYLIVHGEKAASRASINSKMDSLEIIKVFIEKDIVNKAPVEKALNKYIQSLNKNQESTKKE